MRIDWQQFQTEKVSKSILGFKPNMPRQNSIALPLVPPPLHWYVPGLDCWPKGQVVPHVSNLNRSFFLPAALHRLPHAEGPARTSRRNRTSNVVAAVGRDRFVDQPWSCKSGIDGSRWDFSAPAHWALLTQRCPGEFFIFNYCSIWWLGKYMQLNLFSPA